MNLGAQIATFARRKVQPYRVLGRTIIGVNAFLLTVFLGLILLRMALQVGNCPLIAVKSAAGPVVQVMGPCQGAGWLAKFGTSIIDNLEAGLIVAFVSTILLWLVSPKAQVEEDIAALAPWNIREVLHAPLAETENYWFRGRSGRFMRSTVMPALFEAAGRESQERKFLMLLPDPDDDPTLQTYARYRNSLTSETHIWTVKSIQTEIVATILSAARYSNKSHFFTAEVFLKSDFALFRLDMSDDQLVMTREDPKWPAIICSGRSKFYASYREEFRNEADNAKKLDLSAASVPDATPLPSDLNNIIRSLGIKVQFTDDECKAVTDAMEHPRLPYA